MMKTFKYKIYPNKTVKAKIDEILTTCRILYNKSLAERKQAYEERKESISYSQQQNALPQKKNDNEYLNNVHSQVLQDVLRRLDKAFDGFFRRTKAGEKPGYPRFQSKNHYNSFTYSQSGFSLEDSRLKISKIGKVKIKLHRQIEGNIKTLTVIRKNDRYYACFSCEIQPEELPATGAVVGIDMGLIAFVTTSDGDIVETPKTYRKAESALKHQQREVSRKVKGSSRRRKAVAVLSRQHEHVANQRRDISFKVAHSLLNQYDVIVHEDLNIKNMVQNHNLAKSIHDAGWGIFLNMLSGRAQTNAAKKVIGVDPRNTSQICSKCGEIVSKTLSDRVHLCPYCGLEMNRDVNAAINILKRGMVSICYDVRDGLSWMGISIPV
jgi:putative transposase